MAASLQMLRRGAAMAGAGRHGLAATPSRSLWVAAGRSAALGKQRRVPVRLAAPLQAARVRCGFATGGKDKDAEAAPSALAVQNALTVQEKTEWQKKWEDFKGAAFQSRIFEHYKDGAEKIDDFIEDSVRAFVRWATTSLRRPRGRSSCRQRAIRPAF
eukprot:COSAG02_NODE_1370_length_13018_cov_50.973218_3_plen_158_part_00